MDYFLLRDSFEKYEATLIFVLIRISSLRNSGVDLQFKIFSSNSNNNLIFTKCPKYRFQLKKAKNYYFRVMNVIKVTTHN